MSRYIRKEVREQLSARSRELCECCGSAGSMDKHHLIEYHLGGPHTLENLLLLCPSCHRQIPGHLSREQQRLLQEWHHQDNRGGNISSVAQLQARTSSIDIGTVIFKDVRNVMSTPDQNIITLHAESSGLYLNVVMLDDAFAPKLLVLSNKVIVNGGYSIDTSSKRIAVSEGAATWFEAVNADPYLMLRGEVKYKNELISFTDNGYRFRGANLKYVIFNCANQDHVAIKIDDSGTTYNFGGASIRVIGSGHAT